MTSDHHDLLNAGDQLAGYRIDGLLGVGGMGAVYRAYQLTLERPVALKVLSRSLARDDDFLARFQREGRLAAALEHPHILPVYEAGQSSGRAFISMRIVEGSTLAQRASDSPLSGREALDILGQIARALDAAHDAGMLHRDVKPQNILLSDAGHPYLSDFGIATIRDDRGVAAESGTFVGSVPYSSPEQLRGTAITEATDVYALAVVLYQLLTGRLPFDGDSDAALFYAHLHTPPPRLSGICVGAPLALDDVFLSGLAKDPAERPLRASDLIDRARAATASLPAARFQDRPVFPIPASGEQSSALAAETQDDRRREPRKAGLRTAIEAAPPQDPPRSHDTPPSPNLGSRSDTVVDRRREPGPAPHGATARSPAPPLVPLTTAEAVAPTSQRRRIAEPSGPASRIAQRLRRARIALSRSPQVSPSTRNGLKTIGESASSRVKAVALAPPTPPPAAAVSELAPGGRPLGPSRTPVIPNSTRTATSTTAHAPVTVPLTHAFQLTHAPLPADSAVPLLGNGDLTQKIVGYIKHSSGGCGLVTGVRGVGKTTLVQRALTRLAELDGPRNLITIQVNVAKPRPRLLFEIVSRLYEQLEDLAVLDGVDPVLRQRLATGYLRTFKDMKETQSDGSEKNRSVAVTGKLPYLSVTPSAGSSSKKTSSYVTEGQFHDYSEVEVERDFMRIATLLADGLVVSDDPRPPLRRKKQPHVWRPRLIVVLDELDKLPEYPGGEQWLRELLGEMRNLLTVQRVHFVFIAGQDLHDAARPEHLSGGSVFDSAFSWDVYVPCVWGQEDALLDALIPDPVVRASPQVECLRDGLAFCGRGVPRRILRELGRHVSWDDDELPSLNLTSEALRRLEYFAGLQQRMRRYIEHRDDGAGDSLLEYDQWCRGIYFAVHLVLRHRVTFTSDDVLTINTAQGSDPLLSLSHEQIDDLLAFLEEEKLLLRVGGQLATDTHYSDVPAAQAPAYVVTDSMAWSLNSPPGEIGMTQGTRRRAAEWPDTMVPRSQFDGALGQTLGNGRYAVIEEIHRGGTGRIYRGRHTGTKRELALKIFDLSHLQDDDRMRSRFEREARLIVDLQHEHLVKAHEAFEEADGRLVIVTELVSGTSLAQRLSEGPLAVAEAVSIARAVLRLLDYLDQQGIARLDLRPSSIMLDSKLSPTITRLGLAKRPQLGPPDGETRPGTVLGTPAYAAPELLAGEPADIRADIYTVALILVEMLAGHSVREAGSIASALRAAQGAIALESLPISDDLRSHIATALEPSPSRRFADPAAMLAALTDAPESS
jgi:serine/threonine protein kinase